MALELYGVETINSLIAWALLNDMEYDYPTKSIICYKSVLAIPYPVYQRVRFRFFAEHGIDEDPFEYPVKGLVEASFVDTDPYKVCAEGLHGTSRKYAESFGSRFGEQAILRLRVSLDDNTIVVPFNDAKRQNAPIRARKFRFKKCFVDGVVATRVCMTDDAYIRIIQMADAKEVQFADLKGES